jgi:hypothetical protein
MNPLSPRRSSTVIELFKAVRQPDVASPRRLAICRWSRRGAAALTVLLGLAAVMAVALAVAVAAYDGPGIAFGIGGLYVGAGNTTPEGLVPLTSFTRGQRFVGAIAVGVLCVPILLMLYCGRELLACFADGQIFSDRAARLLRYLAVAAVLYAASPFAAHALALLVGVDRDPAALHPHQIMALVAALLLLTFALIVKLGQDIERERDGFI